MKNLEHKTFAMSMFASQKDLFEAKADHYESEAEKLQMELTVEREKSAHLERCLLKVSKQADLLQLQVDELEEKYVR